MRNIILILMLGVIFSGFIQAEEVIQSTVTAKKEPELLWKKEFDGDIRSFAVFHDGSYVAVSIDKGKWNWNKEKNKNEYVGTSKLVLLNGYGKELWEGEVDKAMGGAKLGNSEPIVIWRGQNGISLYNKKGKLMWVRQDMGSSIISPNNKYIAMVHNGIEGVTPQGIKVYDIEGNELWRYKPDNFFNADFLSDNEIILVSVEQYGIAHRIDNNKGFVEIREAETGEIKYEEKIDIPFEVPDIDYIDYHPDENSAEIIFGDKKLLFDLKGKIDIDKIVSKVKSQWSNGWQIETDASVIEINKANQKELLFYQKTE